MTRDRRPAEPRVVVVGAVLIDHHGPRPLVLAARRTTPPVGLWEFPGGKVETGERHADALARELREELGCEIDVGAEVPGGPWSISERLELRLFLARLTSARPPSPGHAHDRLLWLPAEELGAVAWLASDREALPAVLGALARSQP